jgi:Bacterial regulatory proteins, tetR family
MYARLASSITRRPRTKLPEERRDELMNAAERLFLEHGFGPTAIEQITVAAQVAKGTFYSLFQLEGRCALGAGRTVRARSPRERQGRGRAESPTGLEGQAVSLGGGERFILGWAPQPLVEARLSIFRAIREGRLAEVTDHLERTLGCKPIAFNQWAQENAAAFL